MRIAPDLLDEIVAHALRDAPDECCGLVSVRDGAAAAVHPLENVFSRAPKRLAFEMDGMELHRVLTGIEDAGAELGAIYHSHTQSDPYPSPTDINFAAPARGIGWPGTEWLIVGTEHEQPVVRSYLIERGGSAGAVSVTEVPVE